MAVLAGLCVRGRRSEFLQVRLDPSIHFQAYTGVMPTDLGPHLEPSQCAVIVFECQENVLGPKSMLPGLAASAKEAELLRRIQIVLEAGRRVGTPIFYCTAQARSDGLGGARTPLMDRLGESSSGVDTQSVDTSVVGEIAPKEGDVVIERSHGLSAFYGTRLDPCLKDLKAQTVVLMGVSLNIGIFGTALEAVNRGLRVILPSDCTVSDPPEYAEAILRYSIRHLAYLSESAEIAGIWDAWPK